MACTLVPMTAFIHRPRSCGAKAFCDLIESQNTTMSLVLCAFYLQSVSHIVECALVFPTAGDNETFIIEPKTVMIGEHVTGRL